VRGGSPDELLITTRQSQGDEITVAVRDTGLGLDPQGATDIFDT